MIAIDTLDVSDRTKKSMLQFVEYFLDKTTIDCERFARTGGISNDSIALKIKPRRIVGDELMWITRFIEIMLNIGNSKYLLMVVAKFYEKNSVYYGQFSSECEITLEEFEIWLRTHIARDKLMFKEFGLLKSSEKNRGDLRGTKPVVDEIEEICALAQFKMAREDPRFWVEVGRLAKKHKASFLPRFCPLLIPAAKQIEDPYQTKLQSFLLDFWYDQIPCKNETYIPALCSLSDPAITELAKLACKSIYLNTINVRKTWERLGLQKMRKLSFKSVQVTKGKITICEFRRKSK